MGDFDLGRAQFGAHWVAVGSHSGLPCGIHSVHALYTMPALLCAFAKRRTKLGFQASIRTALRELRSEYR
jgi:hypothetical protein